jgi:hypothetical protein
VITIAGTTYFTIGTGLVVLLLAAPLLWAFSVWALRPNTEGKPPGRRLAAVGGLTAVLLLALAVGLFWDVYLIGQRAKVLCEETGLRVYDTVTADSLAGVSSINTWSPYGFRFVENEVGKQRYRYELHDGTTTKIPISRFESRYRLEAKQVVLCSNGSAVDCRFTLATDKIVDDSNGAIVGQLSAYSIDPGWLDSTVVAASGLSFKPWVCERLPTGVARFGKQRALGYADLVRAVIEPLTNPRMGTNEHHESLPALLVR